MRIEGCRFCFCRPGRAWGKFSGVLCLFSASILVAQERPARLTFDVALIKQSDPLARGGGIKPLPGGTGYTAQNIPVQTMIGVMYKVPARQITGGPEWLRNESYDVEARADHSYSLDDLHIMFQNLLVDRFHLKIHKAVKEGPVYALIVDPSGLKMKPDGTGQDLKIPITPANNNEFAGTRVPMQYLCFWLGQQLQNDGRPVIDKTGLTDSYDFRLAFAPQLPPDVSRETLPPDLRDRPSIFDALKQQLGLKLEAQKGPVEYYVIDSIDRPTEN